MVAAEDARRPHVLLKAWRDTGHPEQGGSERYVERVAEGLAAAGWSVTFFTASYDGAPTREVRNGVHYVRRGGHVTVYLWAMLLHLVGRLGRPDVCVDVHNGVPFL
ncbi:MAG: glycosyltransferase, partial [Nitriliruptorales bacterium]|nr:glycosyltransferase [Nitriliruptorales bacterium]